MLICDSQVHAPATPHLGPIPGMEPNDLIREMDRAGVERCVIVPMVPPGGDPSASNPAALEMAQRHPERFGVMAPFDLTSSANASLIPTWRGPGSTMLGARLAFLRDPNLGQLSERRLEWFWSAAEEAGLPIMLLAPNSIDEIDGVAIRYPRLRLIIDHLNLHPAIDYDDLSVAVEPLVKLARHENVAVKASALPCWARDQYPFPTVHGAIEKVVESFGSRRVFWGSDLTRLQCTYSECLSLFTEELTFLTEDDKQWIMGRGLVEWLGWSNL